MSKLAAFVAGIAIASTLVGCAPEDSLFPLSAPNDKAIDERLLGEWRIQGQPEFKHGEDSGRIVFQVGKDPTTYDVTIFTSDSEPNLACIARLVRLGSFVFIDFAAPDSDQRKFGEIPFPTVESHISGRARVEKNAAHIDMLDHDWVANQVKAGKLPLTFVQTPGGPVLSATTEELHRFALGHAEDTEAFSNVYSLSRTK